MRLILEGLGIDYMFAKIISIVFLSILLFEVLLIIVREHKETDAIIRLYFVEAIAITLVMSALISFGLAFFSAFNYEYYLLCIGILIIVLAKKTIINIGKVNLIKNRIIDKKSVFVLLILLGGFLINSMFSIKWTTGWRDYSGYYLQMVHIVDQGSLFYDENISEQDLESISNISSLQFAGLDYEGVGADGEAVYSFNFLHFLSSFLAVFYKLGGTNMAFMAMSLLSMCALYYIFAVMQRFVSSQYASYALVAVLVNPAEVWNSRIMVSEMLCQLLIFMALFYYIESATNYNVAVRNISAILLSLIHLTRIDMYIITAAILLIYIYINLAYGFDKYKNAWMSIYLLLSFLLSLLCFYTNGYYMKVHWEMGVLNKIVYAVAILVLLYCGSCIVGGIKKEGIRLLRIQGIFGSDYRKLKYFFVGLILVIMLGLKWSLFGYFPFFSNLCTLGLYITIPMIIIMFLGVYYSLRDNVKEHYDRYMVFAVFFCELFIYIYNPAIAPDHMWASRRWVTVIIPIALFFSIYGMKFFKSKNIRIILYVGLIICELLGTRAFMFERVLDGCDVFYDEIAQRMSNDEIYFVDNNRLAGMLRVVNHKNTFVLDKFDGVEDYLEDNAELYYIECNNNQSWKNYIPEGIVVEKIFSLETELLEVERPVEHLPINNYLQKYSATMYKIHK